MKLKHVIKNLQPIQRNKEWLSAPIDTRHKLYYYASLIKTYTFSLFSKKEISYLGEKFYFDNLASPLNLQNYPYEISMKINKYLKNKPKTILDIGGNIGQFSLTANYFWPKARIDIIEPNPDIYNILLKNIANKKTIKSYNIALGPGSKNTLDFYYEPGRSATGSFLKANIQALTSNIKSITVKVENKIDNITSRSHYDLVKIDVEGYEFQVLKSIKNINCLYLFIEGSTGRERDYNHSQLFDKIKNVFGDFNILYMSEINSKTQTFDCLLKFKN